MPNLIAVFSRWWKLILGLSLLATIVAYIVAIISPKEYLSTATSLPANSLTADKARIFNANIEALYSDVGTADELDRLEGTGTLDTLFIAASNEFDLAKHYSYGRDNEGAYKASLKLKKNSRIARSAYGELKVKVWDEDRNLAAAMANFIMQRIQAIQQQLQNAGTAAIIEQLRRDHQQAQAQYRALADSATGNKADADILAARRNTVLEQVSQYQKMVDQYQLSLRTNMPVLLTVEPARPSLWPDRPNIPQVILFTLAASLACTILLALLLESRKSA